MLAKFREMFKSTPPPPVPVGEVAWSDSSIYGAKDFPKYNPDSLMGIRGATIYKKMMLDEQIKAVVHFKRDAITARKYYFEMDKEALGEEESDRRIAVFNAIIKQTPGSFVDGLNAIMTAMYNGFALVEKVYDQKELMEVAGQTWVVLKALKLRPFDTFHFYVDQYGNIESVTQRSLTGSAEVEIDISRFIHFVCQPDIDPHYGQSELREAYRPWFSKDHIIKFRNIFLERMAGGMAWIETEKGVTITAGSQTHTDLMNILGNIQTKTGILLPAGLKLNIQWPTGKNDNYESAIASDDKAISKALLVPNLLGITEQGTTGSYAQSQTQLEAFLWTLDKLAVRLSEALNEQLFKELGDLNFGDGIYPRFCFHPISDSLKMNIITKWKELVTAGAVEATDTDEDYLRELLDFPEKGDPIKKAQAIDPRTGLPTQQPAAPGQNVPPPESLSPEKKPPIGAENMDARRKVVALQRASKRVDFAVIEQKSLALESGAIGRLTIVMKDIAQDLIEQVKTKGLTEIVDSLAVKASLKSKIRTTVERILREAWNLGQDHAQREVQKAAASPVVLPEVKKLAAAKPLTEQAADIFLEQRAYQVAGDMSENMRKRVVSTVFNGIKNSWSIDEVVNRISDDVDSYSIPQLNTIVRTSTFEAMNEARYNFFSDPALGGFVEALEYSAILDGRTTDLCRELDGQIHSADSEVWQTYRPPNHFNCRSLLIAVTALDTWQESELPKLLPAEGF